MKPIFAPTLIALSIGMALTACNNANDTVASDKASLETKVAATTPTTTTPTEPAANSNQEVVDALNANLQASSIEQTVISAVPTDMPDLYWVTGDGMPPFFTDKTGSYIVQGQVVQLGNGEPVDITAKLQAQVAGQALAKVPTSEMIIYPAKGDTKAVVYAFTDADCGYCRKLHSEMDDINAEGVEVRYLAWPRSEQTFPKMESIWCSDNQTQAMDTAKAGGNVANATCNSPVQKQFDLGASLGVRGTPAIFTQSGQQIGGYLPARQLAQAAIAN